MKKADAFKYPNSANLFKFCRKVLDHKYGGIRVIDQDVGQILGFDPADCSHWKKGKKNIRSIQAMKNIASHLGIDEKLVVDVASGDLNCDEAYYEYTGYGSLEIDGKVLDKAKKEFHKKNINCWSKEKESSFKTFFSIEEKVIINKVNEIHKKIKFLEAPLYIPEIIAQYPDIVLQPMDNNDTLSSQQVIQHYWEDKKFHIRYTLGLELKPFLRYKISKALASYFLPDRKKSEVNEDLKPFTAHIQDVESNVFASHLLAPKELIQKELNGINIAKDIIVQLAESFWVSKSFINQRLKDILQSPH